MKTKEIISIHDFLKLLDFYKKEIQIKYQDVVNENEHIDTVSEAIVEEKLEPVQEKIEEANIEQVVDELVRQYPQLDYVVVNDGSRDNTLDICREHGFKKSRKVHSSKGL